MKERTRKYELLRVQAPNTLAVIFHPEYLELNGRLLEVLCGLEYWRGK